MTRADEALDSIPQAAVRRFGAHLAKALVGCGEHDPDMLVTSLKPFLTFSANRNEWGSLNHGLIPAAFYYAYRGKRTRAAELLGLALTRRPQGPGWMEKWPAVTRLRADLEAELGAEAYQAAWERGQSLDLEIVVRELLDELGDR
jgi:hypothetical protein